MELLRTTKQWWAEVSADEIKMIDWLQDQFHGEVTAAHRIHGLIETHNVKDPSHIATIVRIVNDEAQHAMWIGELLLKRGIKADILKKQSRYWAETMPKYLEVNTFEYACAVAHLAEDMRLDRIKLLANDPKHKDIGDVFAKIQPDEEFHTKAFGSMSTPEDIIIAKKYHKNGMNALGLIA